MVLRLLLAQEDRCAETVGITALQPVGKIYVSGRVDPTRKLGLCFFGG